MAFNWQSALQKIKTERMDMDETGGRVHVPLFGNGLLRNPLYRHDPIMSPATVPRPGQNDGEEADLLKMTLHDLLERGSGSSRSSGYKYVPSPFRIASESNPPSIFGLGLNSPAKDEQSLTLGSLLKDSEPPSRLKRYTSSGSLESSNSSKASAPGTPEKLHEQRSGLVFPRFGSINVSTNGITRTSPTGKKTRHPSLTINISEVLAKVYKTPNIPEKSSKTQNYSEYPYFSASNPPRIEKAVRKQTIELKADEIMTFHTLTWSEEPTIRVKTLQKILPKPLESHQTPPMLNNLSPQSPDPSAPLEMDVSPLKRRGRPRKSSGLKEKPVKKLPAKKYPPKKRKVDGESTACTPKAPKKKKAKTDKVQKDSGTPESEIHRELVEKEFNLRVRSKMEAEKSQVDPIPVPNEHQLLELVSKHVQGPPITILTKADEDLRSSAEYDNIKILQLQFPGNERDSTTFEGSDKGQPGSETVTAKLELKSPQK